MAKDQMQEVYPVLVSYVDGEQPTANKLNGVLKQTKSSFDAITKAIGDPWHAQSHSIALSPERLCIPSLARMIGPSDFLCFAGNANERSSITATLEADRNSWSLGFPLINSTVDYSDATSLSSIYPITWGDGAGSHNVTLTLTGSDSDLFTTEKSSRAAVVQRGDFFVDYYRGEIITYEPAENDIDIDFTNIKLMGPGMPWATNNVIPTWKETTNLCSVDFVSTSGGYSTYTLTLPLIKKAPRTDASPSFGASVSYSIDSTDQAHVTFDNLYGEDSQYRLPFAIAATLGSPGDEIPEGFFLLWDDDVARVVPNVTFQCNTDEYKLTLVTPESWLEPTVPGSPVTDRYRLICTGTSLAESVGWLLASFRDNRHVGLNDGASIKENLNFTNPISHTDLADRFNGSLDPSYTRSDALLFRESSLPTNEHPQYLHRYGYASDDLTGNSANAMRGWLSFSTQSDYELGDYACNHNTYGLIFGGGKTSGTSNDNNSILGFFGGYDAGVRYPFGVPETGAQPIGGNPEAGKHHLHGALTYIPWYGAPLYLRGRNDSATNYSGAMIGFDLERQTEVNYIKLLPAYRDGSEDYPHMPADVAQTPSASLVIMPALDSLSGQKRIAAEQVREWRFRGVSKVSTATNTDESVGKAARDDGDTNGTQFNTHFTSPGVIGADFVNIYSNAIFFSDTGDGALNSFTVHGKDWIDNGDIEDFPTGMYYIPATNDSGSSESATIQEIVLQKYIVISGDASANYRAGEYVEFEYASGEEVLRIEQVLYNSVLSAGNTILKVTTSITSGTSGTLYNKIRGYFALYNQNSDNENGSGNISLSCGVNHGFAYAGTKFFALSGYSIDGTGDTLSSLVADLVTANNNTIIADSTINKHIGIYSYDGRVDIGTWNTYLQGSDGDAGRNLNIYTSAEDDTAGIKVGTITLETGRGLSSTPSSSDGNIALTSCNSTNINAGSQFSVSCVNSAQITSSSSYVNLYSSSSYVRLSSAKTGADYYGIRLASIFGVQISLDDSTNDHNLNFKNTSSTTMSITASNGLAIGSLSGDFIMSSTGGNISIIPGNNVLIFSGITEATSDTGLSSGQVWIDTSDGRTLKVKA